jgi:O-antigen/teichoic acid export membrane protein
MTPQTLSHKIIKNISWNFLGQGWFIVISLFSTPYIVHHMNVNYYGIYTLVSVIVGYFSFMQMGLTHASVKYIAQYLAADDHEKVAKAFWACVFAYLVLGTVAAVVIVTSSGFIIERFFKIALESRQTAIFAVRIGALGLLFSMLSGAIIGVIRSVGRFDILNRAGLVMGTLQILITIVLLHFGYSLRPIFVANFILQAGGILLYWRIVARLLPFITRPVWDRQSLIELVKFGGFVTVYTATDPILANSEKLFLTSLRSVSSLTYYWIPYALVSRLAVIPSAVLTVLFPIFSRMRKVNNDSVNRELHTRSILYMLYIYTFVFAIFIIFGKPFFAWWIGNDFAERSTTILIILTAGGFLSTMAQPSATLLMGLGKPQYLAIFNVIETVVYLPASYLLIRSYGGIGAASAWFGCMLVNTLLVNTAATRLLEQNTVSFYRDIAFAIIPVGAFCGAAFWLLRRLTLPLLHPLNIGGILLIGATYTFIVWRWRLDGFAQKRLAECFDIRALRKANAAKTVSTALPEDTR